MEEKERKGGEEMTQEERIESLENRVRQLEAVVGLQSPAIETAKVIERKPMVQQVQQQPVMQPRPVIQSNPIPQPTKKGVGEAIVGKYIIGALASLLVFVGAISLVALFWVFMTPVFKLTLLAMTGLVLTVLGFIFIRSHKNPITAIVLGTGAGLLFISIISANMAFNIISSTTAFLLAGVWVIAFILSYKYTRMFFTTVIAYIGSFIATLLGLSLITDTATYVVVIVFVTSTVAAMLISGHYWISKKKQLISMLLSIFSYMVVLLWTLFEGSTIENFKYVLFMLAIVYFLQNRVYKFVEELGISVLHVLVGSVVAFITAISLYGFEPDMDTVPLLVIYLAINIAQLVYVEWVRPRIAPVLTILYSIVLSLNVLWLSTELFDIGLGLVFVAILLIAIDEVRQISRYSLLGGILVLLDTVLLLLHGEVGSDMGVNMLMYSLIGILQVVMLGYILIRKYNMRDITDIIFLKSIGCLTVIINSFMLIANWVWRYIEISNLAIISDAPILDGAVVGFVMSVAVMLLLMKLGYFKYWNNPNFSWFAVNKTIAFDKSMLTFYVLSTLLYFLGVYGLHETMGSVNISLQLLAVLVMAMTQSANILTYNKNVPGIGVWVGLKYLVITWIVLFDIFDVDFNSMLVSLSGLVLALGCIALGFKLRVKSLRLYGLVLTIIMVLKFLLVDISGDNSLLRIVMLILGGIVCFGISLLYNALSKWLENKSD